ncbi:hypothetical protein GCM10027289_28680 [Tsukamurella serpentis]
MNRAERRRAARNGQRPGPFPGPARSDEDRLFHATTNYEVSRQWVREEFGKLHALMGLIEEGLNAASDPDPDHWFPNNITALACLTRAYQSIQAAANLCAMGFYVEANATVRGAYEAAGLARTLAKKTDVAERWIHSNEWVKDKLSKEFADEMMMGDGEPGGRSPHWECYQHLSRWAHPLASSTLRFLFDRDGGYEMSLYPQPDEQEFRDTARFITIQALFVAFTFKNASISEFAIPAYWLQSLQQVAQLITGDDLEHLDRDWERHQAEYERIADGIRHTSELQETLVTDPNSFRNRQAHNAPPEPET